MRNWLRRDLLIGSNPEVIGGSLKPRFSARDEALATPGIRRKFDELGLEPVGNTPAEFAELIRKETPEWAKVIKDAGIKLGN